MNYKIREHVNLSTCSLFCVLNPVAVVVVLLLSATTTFHYLYFRTFLSKGWEGGFYINSWQCCQVGLASGVPRVLMDLVLSSFGASLAPFCSDSTLCRLACTFRGLAWAPQVLKQRRVAFYWHSFSEALLDLDRNEAIYQYVMASGNWPPARVARHSRWRKLIIRRIPWQWTTASPPPYSAGMWVLTSGTRREHWLRGRHVWWWSFGLRWTRCPT